MRLIGLVGAGHMGSGLGWALRQGGHEVVTSLAGRSERTARLAADAGLETLPSLADVLERADVVLVVTPPGEALAAAGEIAASKVARRPLVADLNAIAPDTATAVAEVLARGGFEFVDGSISGPPPTVRPGATIYLAGPRAEEVASLGWTHVKPVVVGERVGAASAVKMSTASVYKGLIGLLTQAMRSGDHYGVLDQVMADLGAGYGTPYEVALAATKAHRYVPEMREIAKAQGAAGLDAGLFEAFAAVWNDVAGSALADGDPESVDRVVRAGEVTRRLGSRSGPQPDA